MKKAVFLVNCEIITRLMIKTFFFWTIHVVLFLL